MNRPRHAAQGGFTLIEMLVTLVIFSLVLSSLVVSLHTGATVWTSVRTERKERAAIDRLWKTVQQDVSHVFRIDSETPAINEQRMEDGGESLSLTVLGPRSSQQRGSGHVWAKVTYAADEDTETGEPVLTRTSAPYVADSPLGDEPVEETVLSHASRFEVEYLDGVNFVPEWSEPEKLPSAVRVIVQSNGRVASRVFSVPVGVLQGKVGG